MYANAEYLVLAADLLPELVEGLREIERGEGAYSEDRLTHASNTIDNMKRIARELLAKLEGGE